MTTHTRTTHVDAPVEKVFDQVKDIEQFLAALQALDRDLTVADLTTTPEGVGSSAEWKSHVFGIPVTAHLTCEECATNQRIVYRSSTGPVWTLSVTPDQSGTTMGIEFEYHSKMPFFATIVDHTVWHPDRDLDRMLSTLKARVVT